MVTPKKSDLPSPLVGSDFCIYLFRAEPLSPPFAPKRRPNRFRTFFAFFLGLL